MNEQIASAEEAALSRALSDPEAHPSYQTELLSADDVDPSATGEGAADPRSPPLEPAKMAEEAMRRAESERDLGSKRDGKGDDDGEAQRSR